MRHAAALFLICLVGGCTSFTPQPLVPADVLAELRDVRPVVPEEGLTPDATVALALIHNPELQMWRRDHDIAATLVISESAWDNPELRLGLDDLYSHDGDSFEWGFGLRFFPPLPGEVDAKRARAEARERRVLARIEVEEHRVAAATRAAHARVRLADREHRIVRAALDMHAHVEELVREHGDAGAMTRLDQTLVALRREELRDELEAIAGRRAVAATDLAGLIGLSPSVSLPLLDAVDAPGDPAPRPSQAELESLALERRADLRALAEAYDEEEQALRLRHLARIPWPRHVQPGVGGLSNHTRLGLSLAMEIPVVDTAGSEIAVAEIDRDRARDAFRARLHGVRQEIRLAMLRLEESERRLRHLAERLQPLLGEAEELTRAALRTGGADVLALVAIQRRVVRARRSAAGAEHEVEAARIALAAATGGLALLP